jgi:hypothetical protein
MDEKRSALLYAHRKNIERYESLLKKALGEHEMQYLEKRLAEERFAIRMLRSVSPQTARQRSVQFPEALE